MSTQTSAVVRRLLRAEPDELDSVPLGDDVALIDLRRERHHGCLRCPSPARVAYIAGCSPEGRRWIDLCPTCASWFIREVDRLIRLWELL